MAVTDDGLAVVALAGVSQVGVGREDDYNLRHINVGTRPTAVAINTGQKYAVVANTLSDSISLIDLESWESQGEISLGPPKTPLSSTEQGEVLFYNANLSLSGWFSCHSCHTDGHSNGNRNDNLGDNDFGAPKRILSLLGVADTAPWAWNGGMHDLEKQIAKSISLTMRNPVPPDTESTLRLGRVYQNATTCARIESSPRAT